ncbi:MAG TPA: FAD-binding protein, partial [Xanthobacteraceae bacterium]
MQHGSLFTRRGAIAGSAASLLAATGRPFGEARAQPTTATGGGPNPDLLTLERSDRRFSALTEGFNRRWTAPNCAKIFIPLTEAGAQQALAEAAAFGPGRFRVRSGGHCYEDFVFSDETEALIDMSLLNRIGQDPQTGVFYAQGGASNWQLYTQLYWRYGLTLPAGSCYSVGLGGHLCGGGYGLLSRLFGLTVDWLTGVHVVTLGGNGNAAANHVTKDGSPDPAASDLFWAHTGGGGGNFGLITRYEFAALPAAPQRAELFNVSWSWDDIKRNGGFAYFSRIVACFEELTASMPPTFFGLLKLQHEAAGAVALVAQGVYDGPQRSAASSPLVQELTRAFLRFGLCECAVAPTCAIVGHPIYLPCPVPYQDLTWWEAVQTNSGSGPNQKGKYKSAYMRTFSADQVAT